MDYFALKSQGNTHSVEARNLQMSWSLVFPLQSTVYMNYCLITLVQSYRLGLGQVIMVRFREQWSRIGTLYCFLWKYLHHVVCVGEFIYLLIRYAN
jgi:hypothetical protein